MRRPGPRKCRNRRKRHGQQTNARRNPPSLPQTSKNPNKSAIAAGSPDLEESVGLPDPTTESTDEELLHCCGASVEQREKAEAVGLAFFRRSIRLQWRGCKAASILRKRHKSGRKWCLIQKQSKLPRSTLWEMAEIYDRATEQGHGEEDVAKYRIWTDVKIAYGVVKERENKQGVPAVSDDVQKDGTQGPVEDESVGQPEGTASVSPIDTGATSNLEGSTHPRLKVVFEDNGPSVQADAGSSGSLDDQQPQPEVATAAKPADNKAQPATKAKKADKKEQENLTPCEIDAGNALLKAAGTWDRDARHRNSKNVAGG